ncbi:amidohydrolase [Agrobacterium tumefaciens]|uniref:amidohydrolase n=1 Tax=Agrobacterium tumefaciens TaxID=358 RepID=UPI000FA48921|nr:amidohydrolase [Agrobacterium tumefaciens]NSX91670.1 amidohydrolase [Agrobacterium tumefaciens]
MRQALGKTAFLAAGWFLLAGTALAGSPDLILYNGAIVTMDDSRPRARALAIAGDRISAIGDDETVRALKTDATRLVNLEGRTVIPGLVDTHIHAIRGGQTYKFETYWYDMASLAEALDRLAQAARARPRDAWVAVGGSWIPEQFDEKRPPAVEELDRAVPDHPAYVQYLYDYALLNTKGMERLKLDSPEPAVPPGIRIERDEKGVATGKLYGHIGAFNALFAAIDRTGEEAKTASLVAFFERLNQVGVTGLVDPSAGPAEAYEPVFALQRQGKLTLRVGYRIPALQPGNEAAWFTDVMAFRPAVQPEGMVNFLGMGENLVFGMNDGVLMGSGFNPPQASRLELARVATFAAKRKIPLEIHAYTDDAASAILDVFEVVDQTYPLKGLRWAMAHLNTGSLRTLDRMKRLDIAFSVQMGPYFEGPSILRANSRKIVEMSPPTRQALDRGIMVAGGTDSTRIGVFGVWQAIEYHVTGRSLGNAIRKPEDQLLTREEALRLYTKNAAWISFAEESRGTLAEGKLADLAVLDRSYLTIPAEEIDRIRSVLTIVNGNVVHDQMAVSGLRR